MRYWLLVSCLALILGQVGSVGANVITLDYPTSLDQYAPYPDDTIDVIGGATGPTAVNVLPGAFVGNGMNVRDQSRLLIAGGRLEGTTREGLNAYGSSQISMFGGAITSLADDGTAVRDTATFSLNGGTLTSHGGDALLVRQSARATIHGGIIEGNGILSDGRSAAGILTTQNSAIDLTGGRIRSTAAVAMRAIDSSQWMILGGTIEPVDGFPSVSLNDSATAIIAGGNFLTTGEFAVDVSGAAKLDWLGGYLAGGIYAKGSSTVHIFGTDLHRSGDMVFGTLADGSVLHHTVALLDDAKLFLHTRVTGDTDGDLDVDLADLNNVRNNFGGTGLGDTNGDSRIDLQDLNGVRNNFGFASSSVAVPEPGTLGLALATLLGVLAARRKV